MENKEVRVLEWKCRLEYADGEMMGGSKDRVDGTMSVLRDLN